MNSDTRPAPTSDSTRLYSAVDRSNETYEPSPFRSRRTTPSGKVSPDGKRVWPQPSLTSKIIVYGGMGIIAAAASAGAVLGIRAIVNGIAGSDEDDAVEAARQRARARRSGPRASQFGPRSSPAMRLAGDARGDDERRAERERAERARSERMRREAARRRAASSHGGSESVIDGVTETVASVTGGIRDVLATVTAAIEGFRAVATQAGDIMGDFNRAADEVKSMLEPVSGKRPTAAKPGRSTAKPDVVDLRDNDMAAQDARAHSL